MKRLNFGLICFLIFANSCGKENYDYNEGKGLDVLQKGEGSVELKLNVFSGVTSKAESSTSGWGVFNLDADPFTVEVFNASGVKIKKWNKYSEVENPIKLNAGIFTLNAFYGDSTATGFDAVYFAGKTNFVVEGQTHKAISVICKQSNIQMKINWGANLMADYTDYTVKVYRLGFIDSLTFVKNEVRSGYIPAGKLKFKVYLTDKQGKKRTYSSSSMDIEALANDFINLTIDTKEVSHDVNLSFEIDSSTSDREFEILIPGFMKP